MRGLWAVARWLLLNAAIFVAFMLFAFATGLLDIDHYWPF